MASAILKRWNRHDYHKMAELGLIGPDERTELIEGEVVHKMSPVGSKHSTAVYCITHTLSTQISDYIDAQRPILLDDLSEPEPDVIVAFGSFSDYRDRHPEPENLRLVVEVSDSTLAYDRVVKGRLYAGQNIAEYWIVNLQDRCVEVYRRPGTESGYLDTQIHYPPDTISPLAYPDFQFAVSDMLP
jgi:Uma2 family endonuclease